MLCDNCGTGESIVINSRPYKRTLRRRRQCISCAARWTTKEVKVVLLPKKKRVPVVADKFKASCMKKGCNRPQMKTGYFCDIHQDKLALDILNLIK